MGRIGAAILTIVGTVVGAYFGAPQLGAVLGALAGSLLFPTKLPNQVGPRLADITTTNSSVGIGIPRGWGTFPGAGNFIAQSDVREVMAQSSQGGKGAPSQTTTTPTYYQDFAIGLNDSGDPANPRPIMGVRTIWANGKPVYDRRPQRVGETDSAFQQRIAASDQLESQFTLYLGTEDQLPDPTLEAFYGVGNISAFRGLAYIVFTNWLCKPEDGNRIPSGWLFEMFQDGDTNSDTVTEYANEVLNPWIGAGDPPINPCADELGQYTYTASNGGGDGVAHPALGTALASFTPSATGLPFGYVDYVPVNHLGSLVTRVATSKTDGFVVGSSADVIDPKFIVLNYNAQLPETFLSQANAYVMAANVCDYINQIPTPPMPVRFGGDNTVYGLSGACGGGCDVSWYVTATLNARGWEQITSCGGPIGGLGGHGFDWLSSFDRFVLVTRIPSAPVDPCNASACNPVPLADGSYPTVVEQMAATTIPGLDGYVAVNGELRKCGPWTKTAGTWHVLQATATETHTMFGGLVNTTNYTKYPLGPARPLGHAQYSDATFWTAQYNAAVAAKRMKAGLVYGVDYPAAQAYAYERSLTQTTNDAFPAILSEVVTDLCEEAGYTASQLDVSQLGVQTIHGYVRTGVMAGRSAIDPLRQACFFDVVESNGKLKFVPRGQPNTFAFGIDDLGASQSGSDSTPPARVQTIKTLDTDLPRRVTVTYLSPSRDYQQGSQQSPVRVQTSAVNEATVSLPMVLDDDAAAVIATSLWDQAWKERWQHSSTVSGKFQSIEPSDCGTIPVDGLNVRVRITSIADSFPATRALAMVRDDDASYNPTAVASAPPYVPTQLNITTPAFVYLLDLPPLVETDDDAGIYCAFAAVVAGTFHGAQLFRSVDAGASYQKVAQATNEATVGTVLAPAGPGGFDVIDGANTISVGLSAGDFENCTIDALLTGSNAVAVGDDGRWEIIQFLTATNVSANVWTLSGLLRGRRGTEHNIGTGVAGDRLVLMSGPGIGRAAMAVTGVGKSYLYRALGTGSTIDQGTDVTFIGEGTALKPFSPTDTVATRNSTTGDWTLSWLRRGRIGDTLQSGHDIPLSEDDEDYEVDILSGLGGTVLRTISTSNESCVYNAAAQISDFGTAQTVVYANVYQISAQIGRGYPGAILGTVPAVTPPVTAQSILAITFGGSGATTDHWAVDVQYSPRTGGSPQMFTFNLAGGSPNGPSDFAAALALQATTAMAGLAVVTHALGVATLTSTTGILSGAAARNQMQARGWCGFTNFAGPGGTNQYSVQTAHAITTTTEGFYGVDLYAPIGAGFAPAADTSYNAAGTYVKRFKIMNVDQDLNASFVAANSPPGAIQPGDYCFKEDVDVEVIWFLGAYIGGGSSRSLIQVFSGDGVGGIVPAITGHSVLGPLVDTVSVTGNRPCVEITLKDGWQLIDEGTVIQFGDPEPSGWTALTSTIAPAVKAYPHGRPQIDTVEFEPQQSPLFGVLLTPNADIAVGQTLRVTVNGTNFDHVIDSTDMLDVSGIPQMPHYLDRAYGAIATAIRATGLYDVTLVERDGRVGSPSLWVSGLSVRAKAGASAYTFTADVLPDTSMTVTVVSTLT